MVTKKQRKLVHEGQYVAEVEVELIQSDDAWAPYMSVEETWKLDDVSIALRRGDITGATKLARVYRLTPVNAA